MSDDFNSSFSQFKQTGVNMLDQIPDQYLKGLSHLNLRIIGDEESITIFDMDSHIDYEVESVKDFYEIMSNVYEVNPRKRIKLLQLFKTLSSRLRKTTS